MPSSELEEHIVQGAGLVQLDLAVGQHGQQVQVGQMGPVGEMAEERKGSPIRPVDIFDEQEDGSLVAQ